MMAIISSTYSLGHIQADGRRYVTEEHTDSTGAIHRVEYLSGVVDYQAITNARAIALAEELANAEFMDVISG